MDIVEHVNEAVQSQEMGVSTGVGYKPYTCLVCSKQYRVSMGGIYITVTRDNLVMFLGLNLQMWLHEMITGGSTQRKCSVFVICLEALVSTNVCFHSQSFPLYGHVCSSFCTL